MSDTTYPILVIIRLISERVEEGINGEVLVALQQSNLKDMGIASVGHRLTILKAVYEVKIKQNVAIEEDDYVPLCMFSDLEIRLQVPVTAY